MEVVGGLRWIGTTFAGFLVFLIGVSLLFESVPVGLFFVVGALFIIPETRPMLTRVTGDVPQVVLVLVLLTSLVAPSVLFDEYETGTYFGTQEDVVVQVTYDGEWRGSVESWNSWTRLDGPGNETVDVRDNHGRVTVEAEKTDDEGGTLTVMVLLGDEVVAQKSAHPGETAVTVEYDI